MKEESGHAILARSVDRDQDAVPVRIEQVGTPLATLAIVPAITDASESLEVRDAWFDSAKVYKK
jgi:hypothetical protein